MTSSVKNAFLVAAALACWFDVVAILACRGFFSIPPSDPPIRFAIGFFIPILALAFLYHSRGALWMTGQALELRTLTLFHMVRFIGIDFLYHYAHGTMPGGFAIPAGVGDIVVAALAPLVAWAISSSKPWRKTLFVAWNILGLLDLAVAVVCGLLYSPSAVGILAHGPTTQALTVFPGSLLPSFFVPLFICVHILALSRRADVDPQNAPL